MDLKQKLFWIKFRPNTITPEKGKIPIILLPRIQKMISKELQTNFIFVGSGGLGKTTLSEIITEDFDTLRINCSMPDQRGIDVIGDNILEHCKNYSIPFKKKNKNKKINTYATKAVLLEEFDNTTPDMRKALRGFIEEHPEVRFIANVNNIAKLQRSVEDKALLSRFNIIDFEAQNKDEIKYLKEKQLNYLMSICNSINFKTDKKVLNSLIDRTFPNFRSTTQLLQEITITGDLETYLQNKDNFNVDVFTFILDGVNNTNQNFYYVLDNYPREKTEDLLNTLSRPFYKHLIENYENIILKNGIKILNLMKEYNSEYTSTIDPETHLVSYITNLKDLVNV